MEVCEPKIKYKLNRRGDLTKKVLEHYLRSDIPCCYPYCPSCKNKTDFFLSFLNQNVFVLAKADLLINFLDFFAEIPSVSFVIPSSIICDFKKLATSKKVMNFKEFVKQPNRRIAIFDDMFSIDVYSKAKELSIIDNSNINSKLPEATAFWYASHLPEINVYLLNPPHLNLKLENELCEKMVDENSDLKKIDLKWTNIDLEEFALNKNGILEAALKEKDNVIDLNLANLKEETKENLLKDKIKTISSIFNNLRQILERSDSDEFSGEYDEFWSKNDCDQGLKTGQLLKGNIRFDKNDWQEAVVTCGDKKNSKIYIFGRKNLNRVIEGDEVVVKILPKSEWRELTSEVLVHESGDDVSSQDKDEFKKTVESVKVENKPNGKVVAVFKRNWRNYAATMQLFENYDYSRKNNECILCVPFDSRVPKIRVNTRNAAEYQNCRLSVAIDNWENNSLYPSGHIIKSLGPIGEIETETKVILLENSLVESPFGKTLENCLPDNFSIPEIEEKNRIDLRQNRLIFSIDPIGCEDIDDVLSVHKLSPNLYEFGVHIADVTYFVEKNSPVDLEARERGTSIYLSDRRIDMIPKRLSTQECSIREGKDRLTVSVFWEVEFSETNSTAKIKRHWFGRSIVNSKYSLNYIEANLIQQNSTLEFFKTKINSKLHLLKNNEDLLKNMKNISKINEKKFYKNSPKNDKNINFNDFDKILDPVKKTYSMSTESYDQVRNSILALGRFAASLRRKREKSGAVSFNSDWKLENKALDQKMNQIKNQSKSQISNEDFLMNSHNIVEEMMVMANRSVAERILKAFPRSALLRRHQSPQAGIASEVADQLSLLGVKGLNFETNLSLAESMRKAIAEGSDQETMNLFLRIVMSEAEYFSTGDELRQDFSHFGLAIDLYTHFTSPIRRYADIVVHRKLIKSMEMNIDDDNNLEEIENKCKRLKLDENDNKNNTELQKICSNLNIKTRSARNAQRVSKEFAKICALKNYFYYKKAIIVGIRRNGLVVLLPNFLAADNKENEIFVEEENDTFFKGVVMLRKDNGNFNIPFNHNVDENEIEYKCEVEKLSDSELKFTVDQLNITKTFKLNEKITVQIGINHKSKNIYRFPTVRLRYVDKMDVKFTDSIQFPVQYKKNDDLEMKD